mmetsp:Transcript_10402/g.14689  ORF Transcript_10402/g.14689 Transcript_10402/m.14689 type:complete len:327 (-) Transcript_10402:34-1014(-)
MILPKRVICQPQKSKMTKRQIRKLSLCLVAVCMVVGIFDNTTRMAHHNTNHHEEEEESIRTRPSSLISRFLKFATTGNNNTSMPTQIHYYSIPDSNGKLPPLSFQRKPKPGKLIDRIYYINLSTNINRNAFERTRLRRQHVPYERIEGQRGKEDICGPNYHPKRCVGVSGLTLTNLHILQHKNLTGISLILEDDYELLHMIDMENDFLKYIPNDWDVVRIDCWKTKKQEWTKDLVDIVHSNPYVYKLKGKGTFFGGTHAMIWRESSVPKLYNVWSQKPFNTGIDVRLNTNRLNSYCLNRPGDYGAFSEKLRKKTDIPKSKYTDQSR